MERPTTEVTILLLVPTAPTTESIPPTGWHLELMWCQAMGALEGTVEDTGIITMEGLEVDSEVDMDTDMDIIAENDVV